MVGLVGQISFFWEAYTVAGTGFADCQVTPVDCPLATRTTKLLLFDDMIACQRIVLNKSSRWRIEREG
jgi:hypothetical protein